MWQLELFVNSGTVCLSIYSLVAAIFGMNIPYTWKEGHGYMFKWVCLAWSPYYIFHKQTTTFYLKNLTQGCFFFCKLLLTFWNKFVENFNPENMLVNSGGHPHWIAMYVDFHINTFLCEAQGSYRVLKSVESRLEYWGSHSLKRSIKVVLQWIPYHILAQPG